MLKRTLVAAAIAGFAMALAGPAAMAAASKRTAPAGSVRFTVELGASTVGLAGRTHVGGTEEAMAAAAGRAEGPREGRERKRRHTAETPRA